MGLVHGRWEVGTLGGGGNSVRGDENVMGKIFKIPRDVGLRRH